MRANMVMAAVVMACSLTCTALAATLPDPTRPYGYSQAVEVSYPQPGSRVEWVLNGIRLRDQDRTAIVNGKIVREGDEIDNATVVEIGETEVVLAHDHRRIVVRLLASNVKSRAGEPVPGGNPDNESNNEQRITNNQ